MTTTIYQRDPLASTVHLPAGEFADVLDALAAHFPQIDRAVWRDRFARGRVLDEAGHALPADAPCRAGMVVHYYREVVDEPVVPFAETVLHADAHLVVADKPPFLPVAPTGKYVEQTLLRRLQRKLDCPDLAPLHRIDRATSGLVLFSANPATRGVYQALFRERRIEKHYEALAPALPGMVFPCERRARIERGEPFFRMREVDGEPNSLTRIDVLECAGAIWRYALQPISGCKHQLRVHMAALGAPICGDALYPVLIENAADDDAHRLRLLARTLAFVDPLSGEARCFESRQRLPNWVFLPPSA